MLARSVLVVAGKTNCATLNRNVEQPEGSFSDRKLYDRPRDGFETARCAPMMYRMRGRIFMGIEAPKVAQFRCGNCA